MFFLKNINKKWVLAILIHLYQTHVSISFLVLSFLFILDWFTCS